MKKNPGRKERRSLSTHNREKRGALRAWLHNWLMKMGWLGEEVRAKLARIR